MTFAEFSEMNRRRCESYNGFRESLQEESKYTLEHWAMSIVAEAGEICDAILGWRGLKASRAGKTKDDIAKELADVITYCDLALQKLGYDTGTIVRQKFNEVNARCGFGERFAIDNAEADGARAALLRGLDEGRRRLAAPSPGTGTAAAPMREVRAWCDACGVYVSASGHVHFALETQTRECATCGAPLVPYRTCINPDCAGPAAEPGKPTKT